MGVEFVYKDVKPPKLAKVRRNFIVESIVDIPATVHKTMTDSGIASKLKKNALVGIGIGSRGITNLPAIAKATVDWFKAQGTEPFIFPAMGSHGGGTAEGQILQLSSLGITEESVGCSIRSDMNTVVLDTYKTGVRDVEFGVHFDPNAYKADAVFVIARIKPHPDFTAAHESGLCKMLTIGCGKHNGADAYHRLGYEHFPRIMIDVANILLEKVPHIIGGLGLVENALHGTSLIECVPREIFMQRDAEILPFAKKCMPDLPVKEMHTLILDYVGKNISGSGMDPNITGRFLANKANDVRIAGLAVLNLTDETYGNAYGIGAIDYITKHLFEQINFEKTYLNGLTDPVCTRDVSIPPIMANDHGAICMALLKGNLFNDPALVCRIRDTLSLDKLLVSQAILDKIVTQDGYTVIEEPQEMKFDKDGNFEDKYKIWDTF